MSVNQYKHELLFVSLGHTDWLEICEPIGFDGAEFTLEQDAKRYGRDISYLSIDKVSFIHAFGIKISVPRIYNSQGDVTEHLDFCLNFHLQTIEEFGFESVTKYRISLNGIVFKEFTLDYNNNDLTDGYSYVNCTILDNNNVAEFKRNFDTKFNALGTKDVKDNTITPIPTFNYLRRATSQTNTSKFKSNNIVATASYKVNPNTSGTGLTTFGRLANPSNVIVTGEINNTLSFLSNIYAQGLADDVNGVFYPIPVDSGSFQLLEAKNDFTNIQINITNVVAKVKAQNFNYLTTQAITSSGKARLLLLVGGFDLSVESFIAYELWSKTYSDISQYTNIFTNVPSSFSINIPVIERNQRVYLFFANDNQATFNNLTEHLAYSEITTEISQMDVEIIATETAIDSVIKASRYIDLIKQGSKFINGLSVNASLFDNGGVHYDQAVFCRNMITQNNYFYTSVKNILESINEVNCDYEITENELFIGRDKNFYKNVEIGVFANNPDFESNYQFNDRLMINNLKYGYSKYAQDRVIVGTDQSIHTDSEWIVPNLKVENKKEISNKFARDGKYIQDIINIEIKTPTTTTENDDDVLIEDFIALPPSSFGTFGARLLMRWQSGNLEILNRDSNGDSSDVVINWNNLGQVVGGTFYITNGVNVGTYTIVALTNSVITLNPTTAVTPFDGDGFVKFKYFYTNVPYQTRLNEGFLLPNSGRLPNIAYSIKRNLKYFSGYLASCMLFAKTKLRNTYFKGNGTFTSQLFSESTALVENADYLYTNFDAPLIGAKTYDLNLVANYIDVYNYLVAYKTDKGFIRCYDNLGNVIKGFVQKLGYNLLTNELKVTIEEVYEPKILMLTFANGILNVNDVAYNLSGVSDWWKFENDYVKFYDNKSIPISNFYKYNFVNLNGIVYNTRLDLQNALISLV